jgi:hypothetical protein
LEACNQMEVNGQAQGINKKIIEDNIEKMAKKGNRVIAIAYKKVNDPNIATHMKSNGLK